MKLAAAVIILAALAGMALLALQPDRGSMSGGVVHDRTDHSAPKIIESREITDLEASFWLEDGHLPRGRWTLSASRKSSGVVLLSIQGRLQAQTQLEASFLADVQDVIERFELVKRNGMDRVTSGLPYQFSPCSLRVAYASGERLYFRSNGNPREEWPKSLLKIFLRELDRTQHVMKQEPL